MLFAPIFVVLSAIFQRFACGSEYRDNILINPNKSPVFLQVFMNNAIQTGSIPVQQADIAGIIETMMATMSAAQSKATSSAFASVIVDLITRNGDGRSIRYRNNAIRLALENTYAQMGERVDRRLIQEISNQINAGIAVGIQDQKNVGVGVQDQKNIGLGVQDQKNVGLGIPDQKNMGLTLASNVGADVDVAANFKLRLLTGLKAGDIFNGYSSVINQNQLYIASTLLVQLLSARFNLQLGNSYIASCYKALSAVNVNQGLDAYLAVFADFTSQLLVQQGLLIDIDVALRTSCESIILACSKAFNLNIDIAVAVDIALDTSVRVGTSTDIGLTHGGKIEVGSGLNYDVSVKIAKKFGCVIKTSQDFDLAVFSGNRKSVLRSIVPAFRASLGVKAANAFAHCVGEEEEPDVGIGLGLGRGVDTD